MRNKKPIFLAGRLASAAISVILSNVLTDPFQYAQKGIAIRTARNRFSKKQR